MNGRKRSKLKKHPLIRLIRGILRLVRVLFSPKKPIVKSLARSASDKQTSFDLLPAELPQNTTARQIARDPIEHSAPEISTQDPLIETIGEVLGRVRWQIPPTIAPTVTPAKVVDNTRKAVQPNLASSIEPSLETIGTVFDRVKWQIPTGTGLEKVASTSVGRHHDVSLN